MHIKKVLSTFLFTLCILNTNLYCQGRIDLPDITVFLDSIVAEHKIILERDDIEALNLQDLAALLQSQGIQILEYGAYGLQKNPSIRGFTDETVRVVIDGLCVNNAQYGTFDFTSLNIDDIERIEIIKGGFSEGVTDEGAVGGAIYITTRRQAFGQNFSANTSMKTYFNINRFADTFSQNISWWGQAGSSSFFQAGLKGTWAENQYLYKTYRKKTDTRKNSAVADGNADFKINHYFRDGSCITASDLFYIGNKNVPGTERNTANPGIENDINNKLTFTVINPMVARSFYMTNTAGWFKDYRTFRDNTENSIHNIDTFNYCGEFKFFEMGRNIKIHENAGVSAQFVHLDSTNDGIHNQFSLAINETTGIDFNRWFSMSIPMGLKICGSNAAFIPKVGFRFTFYDYAFAINAYRMVQFPNMDDMYWNSGGFYGNPDLKPEKGFGSEFTFISENKILPFSATVFTNYYSQKIQWTSENGIYQPQNVASAFYLGADLDFKKSFLNDSIILSFAGEYLYTRLLDKKNTLTYGKRIMWTPDFTASLSSIFNFRFVTVSTSLNFTGKRYVSNSNKRALQPYLLWNLSADFTGWKFAKPYLRIDNILNWQYHAVDGYPMPGISLSIGCKFNN